jgi:hypothetical protein
MKRIVTAFFFAPLIAAVLCASVTLFSVGFPGGGLEFLVTVLVTYLYAVNGTVILALPAYLVLRRFNLVRWWSALGAGAALGLLFALLVGGSFSAPLLRGIFPLTLIGAGSGLVFWLICLPATPPNNPWRGP